MLGVRKPVQDAPYWEWLLPDDFGEGQVWVGFSVPAPRDEQVGLLRVEQKCSICHGCPVRQVRAIWVGGLVAPVSVPAVEVAGITAGAGASGSEPGCSLFGGGL